MNIKIQFIVKYIERVRYSNTSLVDEDKKEIFDTYHVAKQKRDRLIEILNNAYYKDGEPRQYLVSVDENIYLLKQYETIVDDSNINNVIRDINITEIIDSI